MSQPSESRTFASDGKLMQPSSLHDLANYQRYWEDLHQRTLMQIQQIKDAEKNSTSNQTHNHPSPSNHDKR